MSRVVIGVGASHTTLMNTRWDEVDHLERAHRFRDALAEVREAIQSSGADVAVVVGPNHFRGLWLDLMPTFVLGVGEVIGAGEHGTPAGPQASDPLLAARLLDGFIDGGFDPAFSAALQVDHGITHAIQYVLPDELPVVPLVVNCFAPPLPPVHRCASLGATLGRVLAADGLDRRVAVVASGGLSHQLPFPDWRAPATDDDRYLVESWTFGRDRWRDYETRRRSIVTSAAPALREDFDAEVLGLLERGDMASLVEKTADWLGRQGGNGAQEVRTWVAMAAACGWAPGRTLAYAAMPEWLTGMAVAIVPDPTPTALAAPEEGTRP